MRGILEAAQACLKPIRRWSTPVVGVLATCLFVAACGSAATTSSSSPPQAVENEVETPGACLSTSAFPLTDGKATVSLDREQLDASAAVLTSDCTYSLSGDDVVTIAVVEFSGTVTIAGLSEIDAAIVGLTSEEIGEATVGCAIEGDGVDSGVTVGDSGSHNVTLIPGQKITVRAYRDICQFGIGFAPNTNCANTPTLLRDKAIAIDINKADCFYQAPVTITADVVGGINFFLSPPPIKCSVVITHQSGAPESFVLDTNSTASESEAWDPEMVGRSIFGFIIGPNADDAQFHGSWPLGSGDTVGLSAADGANCRFQIQWTPDPKAPTTTTIAPTTTAAPTTTTTVPATTTTTVAATTTTAPTTTTTAAHTTTTTVPATTTTTVAATTTTALATTTTATTTVATTTTVVATTTTTIVPVTTTTTIEPTTTTAPTTLTTAAAATTTTSTTTTTAPSTTTSIAPTTTSVATTTTAAVTTTIPATTTTALVSTTTTTIAPTSTTARASTTIPPTTSTTAAPPTTTTAGIGLAVALAGLAIAGAVGLLLLVRRRQGANSDQ